MGSDALQEGDRVTSSVQEELTHAHKAAHHLIEVKREQKQDRSFKRPNDEHFRERAVWRHFVPVEEGVVRVRIVPSILRYQNSGTDSK